MLAVGPFETWEDAIRLLVALAVAYLAFLWLAAIVWTYRDAKDRSTDPVSQAVAVILVVLFSIPGLFLYLVLRPTHTLTEAYERNLESEAILHEIGETRACPSCKGRVEPDFLFCPHCGVTLREPCPKCSKPLSLTWQSCPYCGTKRLPGVASFLSSEPKPEPETSPTFSVTPPPS